MTGWPWGSTNAYSTGSMRAAHPSPTTRPSHRRLCVTHRRGHAHLKITTAPRRRSPTASRRPSRLLSARAAPTTTGCDQQNPHIWPAPGGGGYTMLAAVLGFAAATGACPTGSDWCYRSKVPGVEYVTFGGAELVENADKFARVAIAKQVSTTSAERLREVCLDELNVRLLYTKLHSDRGVLAQLRHLSTGIDKRVLEWVDACDTTALDLSSLAQLVQCNVTSKECVNLIYDGKQSSTTCEFDAVEVIDCPGGDDDDDMVLAIILSVVGVVVFSLAVVAVVYKRNAGESGPTTVTLL